MPADKLVPQRLRFKLLKWEGDAAGKRKALTKVAEGNWADLHRLPEPAAGVYLLWLEVPRADQSPLHHADWILIRRGNFRFITSMFLPKKTLPNGNKQFSPSP